MLVKRAATTQCFARLPAPALGKNEGSKRQNYGLPTWTAVEVLYQYANSNSSIRPL